MWVEKDKYVLHPLACMQVLQQDPLQLFNVTGTDRYDVVYAVDAGQLSLMLYILDPGVATPIS